jgi:hypothetical protein
VFALTRVYTRLWHIYHYPNPTLHIEHKRMTDRTFYLFFQSFIKGVSIFASYFGFYNFEDAKRCLFYFRFWNFFYVLWVQNFHFFFSLANVAYSSLFTWLFFFSFLLILVIIFSFSDFIFTTFFFVYYRPNHVGLNLNPEPTRLRYRTSNQKQQV